MQLKENYTNIDRVLEGIIYQVNDSITYCDEYFSGYDNPEQLFKQLRLLTTYKNDPKGIELLQSVPTLFENNYWNHSGYGDCDCFVILTLAASYCNNWNENYIYLVGRTKKAPVHIYSATKYNGKIYTLDLTNPYINIERDYPLQQIIKLKTQKK